MDKITGIRPQVSTFQRLRYENIKPNIKSLCDKAITGKIEQGDLNHLVVHLENNPKAFRYESGDIAKFIFLPIMEDASPEAMKETARFGLELLVAEGRPGHWTAKEIIEKLDKAEPPKPAPGPIAPPPIVTPRPLAAKPAPVPPPLPARPVTPPPLPKPVPVAPTREVPPPTKPVTPKTAVAPATIREPLKPERSSGNSRHQIAIQQADELFESIHDTEAPPPLRPGTPPPLPKPVPVVQAREVTPPTRPAISIKIGTETLFFSEVTYYASHGGSKKIKTGILAEDCILLNLRKGMEVEFDQLGLFSAELSRPARFGTIDLPAGTRVAIFIDGKLYQATLYRAQSFYGVEYPAGTIVWFDHDQQYPNTIKIIEKNGKTIGGEYFSQSLEVHFLPSGKIKMAHYHGNEYEWDPLPVAVKIWGRTLELRNAYVYFNEAGEKESIELIEGQELFGHSLPAGTVIVQEKTGKIVAQTPDGKSKILAS